MIEVAVYLIGCLGGGLIGYSIREFQYPAPKRDKLGRYTKRK